MKIRQTLVALLSLLSLAATARDDGMIVWTEKNFPLAGMKVSLAAAVSDESGTQIPEQRLQEIHRAVEDTLAAHQLLAQQPGQIPAHGVLEAKISVTSFRTGDALGRWIGFGAGAAKCTLRARLLDSETSEAVAEIIDTKVVDTGGFYTLGVDSKFHMELATEMADAMVKLLVGEEAKK